MTNRDSPLTETARALRVGALGVWAGALLMTGAAAMVAFPTMRGLEPVLPAFAAYPEDHWAIAAGHIMRRVFALSDGVQLFAMVIVIATLVADLSRAGWRRRSIAWRVRCVVILAASAIVVYSALIMSPRINTNLDAYWDAAKAGDIATARAAKNAFDGDHTLAGRMMTATFALVAAGLLTSALGAAGDVGTSHRREDA